MYIKDFLTHALQNMSYQFTDVVLPTCNYLFELGEVSVEDRASAVKTARAIAALVREKKMVLSVCVRKVRFSEELFMW